MNNKRKMKKKKENVVFIHNGILFSHKEEWNFVIRSKWMELENIILSKVSQAQKAKKITCSPYYAIIDLKQMQ
jgi:hypothetical protein